MAGSGGGGAKWCWVKVMIGGDSRAAEDWRGGQCVVINGEDSAIILFIINYYSAFSLAPLLFPPNSCSLSSSCFSIIFILLIIVRFFS